MQNPPNAPPATGVLQEPLKIEAENRARRKKRSCNKKTKHGMLESRLLEREHETGRIGHEDITGGGRCAAGGMGHGGAANGCGGGGGRLVGSFQRHVASGVADVRQARRHAGRRGLEDRGGAAAQTARREGRRHHFREAIHRFRTGVGVALGQRREQRREISGHGGAAGRAGL